MTWCFCLFACVLGLSSMVLAEGGAAFPVVDDKPATLLTDPADFKVVQIAAGALADDVKLVSGQRPAMVSQAGDASGNVILAGTLGKNQWIDQLVKEGKLDVKAVEGQWESFIVAAVDHPLPKVDRALVIAGSDRRGTAYGIFEVSKRIGVSPWSWWADVPAKHQDKIALDHLPIVATTPAVKYRGIFINDEDWGLQPWAAKTYEPEENDIGPRTYARVFELLLRLRGNYCWPAMHPCSAAFNKNPHNKEVADDYAIVMGASHCEPLLRNGVREWDEETLGAWNYATNRDTIYNYWDTRVAENGKYENVYTVGMRGIHDSGMPGGGTLDDKVKRLETIFADQRKILAEHVNADVTKVPQIFCPYKEVLEIYDHDLKLPDDVTIVWADDNHGYIRQLSNTQEQKRSGGSGVYYHVSYWGAPADYLWLCTTPPVVIWEEMTKAYAANARTLWVVNVGDIKPAEVAMTYWFELAWNASNQTEFDQRAWLREFAVAQFGPENAEAIADALNRYYALSRGRRPEHLAAKEVKFTADEVKQRLAMSDDLLSQVDSLEARIPSSQKDALYELLVYPARCAALQNIKFLDPARSAKAYEQIQKETDRYNNLAGGKWRHLMSAHPRDQAAFKVPDPKATLQIDAAPASRLVIEAEKFDRAIPRQGVEWKVVPELGRASAAVIARPLWMKPHDQNISETSPALEYDIDLEQAGTATVSLECVPTQPLNSDCKARYAIAIDNESPQLVDIATAEFSKPWSINVLRGAAIGKTQHTLSAAGKHTLRIFAVDPGLVLDRIRIDVQ